MRILAPEIHILSKIRILGAVVKCSFEALTLQAKGIRQERIAIVALGRRIANSHGVKVPANG